MCPRKYYYYWIPIGDLSVTFQRRIGDPSETDIPDRRPIGDQHALSETDHACGDPSEFKYICIYLNKAFFL